LLAVVAALMPIPTDPVIAAEDYGAGASSVEPSYSGLEREFPPSNEPAANPTTAEKAELGRLLFFDPILSTTNDTACASCHQPDRGFSDGQALASGISGADLARNVPTLWNVGYAQSLFWDGREDSLEAQVLVPLTHPDEMGVDNTAALIAEIQAVPEYVALFEDAFGGGESAVSLDHLQQALAAFERTVITNNSPFDRYAAGEFDALTPAQRRGLILFRSAATRCFECHAAPTFATNTFRVVGVQDDDPGRGGISSDAAEGAFKVPTLRNIALSAPYMHNGSFATLEEVVDFYGGGGGRAHNADNVDNFVIGFELTDQEKADLVAFLYALTDESGLPEIPTEVPSGLPVIEGEENPVRETIAEFNTGVGSGRPPAREPMTIVVQAGETIQSAVDQAQP
jgi:cytochrome c peroxidase